MPAAGEGVGVAAGRGRVRRGEWPRAGAAGAFGATAAGPRPRRSGARSSRSIPARVTPRAPDDGPPSPVALGAGAAATVRAPGVRVPDAETRDPKVVQGSLTRHGTHGGRRAPGPSRPARGGRRRAGACANCWARRAASAATAASSHGAGHRRRRDNSDS